MKKTKQLTSIFVVSLLAGLCTEPAQATKPSETMEAATVNADNALSEITSLTDTVLKDLATATNQNEIISLVTKKILPKADVAKMTRRSLGVYARQLSPEQQAKLEGLFTKLMMKTYANAFMQAKGAKVSHAIVPGATAADAVSIRSKIMLVGAASPMQVIYKWERSSDKGDLVTDVVVEGVSIVQAFKSNFAVTLERSGIDGLIDELTKKTS